MQIEIQEVVKTYCAAGLNPIPLHAKGKRPKGIEWQLTKKPESEKDALERFRTGDNIGLLCGCEVKPGWFHVVADFDYDFDKFQPNLLLYDFFIVRSGRRGGEGHHVHFLTNGKVKSRDFMHSDQTKAGQLLSRRKQVVAPPSVHPTGDVYTAVSGAADKLPEIPKEQIEKLFPPHQVKTVSAVVSTPVSPGAKEEDAKDRILDYAKRTIRESQPGECHNTLNRICFWIGGFVGAGLLDAQLAGTVLFHAAAPHFSGEGKARLRKEEATVRDALEKGAAKPLELSKPVFKDAPQFSDYEWELILRNLKGEKPQPVLHKVPEEEEEKLDEETDLKERDILAPQGIVGDLTHHIIETSHRPLPTLSLAASLSFFGMLLGQRISDSTGFRTNLNVVAVAGTGFGKDHSRKVLRRLSHLVGLDYLLPGEEATSGTAIERVMSEFQRALFMFDEWGDIIASVISGTAPSYKSQIVRVLQRFFSAADGFYKGSEFSDAKINEIKRVEIEQPCLCIYATTTPVAYFGRMKSMQVVNGFMNRFLHVIADTKRPKRQSVNSSEIPDYLVKHSLLLHELPINKNEGAGKYNNSLIQPSILPHTKEAAYLFTEFGNKCDEIYSNFPRWADLWVRAYQFAGQIALINAGANLRKEITSDDVLFAINFVEFCVKRTIHSVDLQLGENEHEHYVRKVLQVITESGINGLLKATLTRKTQYLRLMIRNEILSSLLESGEIIVLTSKDDANNITMRYWAFENAPSEVLN